MDGDRFDTLARRLVVPSTRRGAERAAAVGGILSALGLGRATPGARAAQGNICVLDVAANVRLGPSVSRPLTQGTARPGELRGQLTFALADGGTLEDATLQLADGVSLPVVGQATGYSLQIRIALQQRAALVAVGVGEREIADCRGAIDGVVTGPQAGDVGDWHATATRQAGRSGGANASGNQGGGANQTQTNRGGQSGGAQAAAGATASQGSGRSNRGGSTGSTEPPPSSGSGGAAAACAFGLTRCGSECVDLMTDPGHCGACSSSCLLPSVCQGGVCGGLVCLNRLNDCGIGRCVDHMTDADHCGGCVSPCPPDQLCQVGVCTAVQACAAGLSDCGGLCIDLMSDALNCGTCGLECAYGERCSGGACQSLCASGLSYCNGVCVNTASDSNHCGFCGRACVTGIGEICVSGQCAVSACPHAECEGTCVDHMTDPTNCGACGVNCGDLRCVNGICSAAENAPSSDALLTCAAAGLTDCGGVCVDTLTDPANCGVCGMTCAGDPCISGVCTGVEGPPPADVLATCEAQGLTDCGGVCVDLLTDHNNCGACGHACYPGLCSSAGDGTCTTCTEDVIAPGFCADNP